MIARLRQWYYAARSVRNLALRLGRCVVVEAVLLDVANGKREMLTKQECRELAFRLAGVGK